MRKGLFVLAIVAVAFFGGIATGITTRAADCNATGNGNAFPASSNYVVKAGDCAITEVVDFAKKSIIIEAGRISTDFTVGTHRNAWIGYRNATDAYSAACTGVVPDRISNSLFQGFKIQVFPLNCDGTVPVIPVADCDVFNPNTADNSVPVGTVLPVGACAITEIVNVTDETISIRAGRLSAPFTVAKDHNAWAGYGSIAEASQIACSAVVPSRHSSSFFWKFFIEVDPDCTTVCISSGREPHGVPSGTKVQDNACAFKEVVDFQQKRITLTLGPLPSFVTGENVNAWIGYSNPARTRSEACKHIAVRRADPTFKDFQFRMDFSCPKFFLRVGMVVRN